ncbi:hypothetical protein [Dyadobacter frigoris]|uniref:Uncharacterized protein n=1 Tax=Dyadobacter frigoris TaxID=2576211 RepID=A0A4U6CRA6_9BACT|nr:hypothetical protein [Dyadobacter frigoris]TKT85997.1 hypothetical protein FDK13_32890 [Dyadobacter frigoris]
MQTNIKIQKTTNNILFYGGLAVTKWNICSMTKRIGQLIKSVAEGQGLSQQGFGEKINKTKQGIASIYKRGTIDTNLLKEISIVLNYDFFVHLYDDPDLRKFKEAEYSIWQNKIDILAEKLDYSIKLTASKEETLATQRKLIAQLEEKIRMYEDETE